MHTYAPLPPHLSSAAWLYTQLEPDRASPLVDLARLRHYQRLFAAHLDGLLAAGQLASEVAAAELARWKGEGELFAAMYLALALQNEPLFLEVLTFLHDRQQPPFLDAAAQVFLWLPSEQACPLLEHWQVSDDPLLRQVALNALGLRREPPATSLEALFAEASPGLRAEACRLAGRLRLFNALPLLQEALHAADAAVREQAAVALLLCNQPECALPGLLDALQRHAATAEAGMGIAAIRAERRAQHLARLLGHAMPYPCSETAAAALCAELPAYLTLLVVAHHGNPALIPLLLHHLDAATDTRNHGHYKRRALWAMSFILGINPETEGLLADAPSLSADWPRLPGLDQDTGLPEADAVKVARWWLAHKEAVLAATGPLLGGHSLNPSPNACATTCALLESGPQARRFAAALHRCRLSPTAPLVDTRAPVGMQQRLWLRG